MGRMITGKSGTYALILEASLPQQLKIGKLGTLQLATGCYVYVGSAFGPGGLRARLAHHSRSSATAHWHIDYLKKATRIEAVWYTTDRLAREHHWANTLGAYQNASVPLERFGATECDCRTHLIFFSQPPSGPYFIHKIRRRHPDHAPIRIICPTAAADSI